MIIETAKELKDAIENGCKMDPIFCVNLEGGLEYLSALNTDTADYVNHWDMQSVWDWCGDLSTMTDDVIQDLICAIKDGAE